MNIIYVTQKGKPRGKPFTKGNIPANKIQDELTDKPMSKEMKYYYRKKKKDQA